MGDGKDADLVMVDSGGDVDMVIDDGLVIAATEGGFVVGSCH